MDAPLPEFSRAEFGERLAEQSPEPLPPEAVERLYLHYLELKRWNPRLSLIGRGSAGAVIERHYGESLAALPLVGRGPLQAVDLGSGAGFPGWVLAAVRPRLEMTLVESRSRKWSFLRAASRAASLRCRCLNARVASNLPEGFPPRIDLVTVRALKLNPGEIRSVASRMRPGAAFLFWLGREEPRWIEGLEPARRLDLAGADFRRILEVRRT